MDPFSHTDISIGAYHGRVNTRHVQVASLAWLEQVASHIDAAEAVVLAEGRNRNVRVAMPVADGGTLDVVVKAFGRGGALQAWRDRRAGSKARRTWLAAVHLTAVGAGTPEPIAFIERWAGSRLVESYVVTAYQHDMTSLAHALDTLYRQEPDCEKLMALLDTVAAAVRRMHEGGFLHNDLGNQNILLRRDDQGAWGHVQFIDLNRGRIKPALSGRERARDLSRIALPSDFRRVFFEMVYQVEPPPEFLRWESHYRRRFAWHSRTRRWRHPIREARKRPAPGDPPQYPEAKDIWIWDERSGQPLVTMVSRDRSKHYPLSRNLHVLIATLKALPAVWRAYGAFRRQAFGQRVAMRGRIGVAVDVYGPDLERRLGLLEKLGSIPVMVRFYHHRGLTAADRAATAVELLVRRGHPVSIALVQDRQAVREPEAWRTFVDRVLERLASHVELVEAGHAINRVKWGVWDFGEYRRLMEPFVDWQARYPDLCIGGPAMIDFEYAYVPAALDALPEGLRFGALTHHLYVDRRGAPETPQGRFAALEKFALARALAGRAGDRLIVSEFNWPLAGTGVYSPVGAPYVSPGVRHNDPSVGEQEAAAYLLRYVLIAICSGLVERVFWWRLAAFGYGLVDDSGDQWRERPAYQVLALLLVRLATSVFTARSVVAAVSPAGTEGILYRFEMPDGRPWWMAYTLADVCRIPVPPDVTQATTACGETLSIQNAEVELGMMPVYLDVVIF